MRDTASTSGAKSCESNCNYLVRQIPARPQGGIALSPTQRWLTRYSSVRTARAGSSNAECSQRPMSYRLLLWPGLAWLGLSVLAGATGCAGSRPSAEAPEHHSERQNGGGNLEHPAMLKAPPTLKFLTSKVIKQVVKRQSQSVYGCHALEYSGRSKKPGVMKVEWTVLPKGQVKLPEL